jgi:Mrp family chromosome partitioning ATPase
MIFLSSTRMRAAPMVAFSDSSTFARSEANVRVVSFAKADAGFSVVVAAAAAAMRNSGAEAKALVPGLGVKARAGANKSAAVVGSLSSQERVMFYMS